MDGAADPGDGGAAARSRFESGLLHGALGGRRQKPAAACEPVGCRASRNRTATTPGASRSGATNPPQRSCRPGRSMPRSETQADAAAVPLATYRLQLTKDFGFDDAAALVPYLKRPRHHPSLCLAVSQGAARQHARLRHRRSRPAQSRARRRGRLRAAVRGAEAERPRADPRFRAQPHGRRPCRQCLVARRAGMGAEARLMPWLFDIDWDALPHRRHPGVLLPILGRPYGEALQSGEIALQIRRRRPAASRPGISTTSCRSIRSAMARCCARIVAAADAAEEPAGRALLALADDYRDPARRPIATRPRSSAAGGHRRRRRR